MREIFSALMLFLFLGIPYPAVYEIARAARSTIRLAPNGGYNLTASPEFALIFPQTANGSAGGFAIRSSVILINNTRRGASGTLHFYSDYSPTGKLPYSWPRNISQVPISIGDPGYVPLFPYGFGLTY